MVNKILYLITMFLATNGACLSAHDYQALVNTFAQDKAAGARMWVEHMSNTTQEEYLARLASGSPAEMVFEWVQGFHESMGLAIQQFQLPEEVRVVLRSDYTEQLMLEYTAEIERLRDEKHPALPIEELRKLIVGHFMRVYELIEKNANNTVFLYPLNTCSERYDDGLLKFLYGLCELTLQRWAEHDISRPQLETLFERQYQAFTEIVPAACYCMAKARELP
jgi:hypothetical protein